jgi:hypothetical protein
MIDRLSLVMLMLAGSALAQDRPAQSSAPPPEVQMTAPVFEMFRLAPGQTEAFIRSMAMWDKVSIAGGQPPTQLFLHAGGEGWDVLLYKPARPKPTPAQEAAMAAKTNELGLATGALYFLEIREQMADHIHFEATGPTTAQQWLEQLDRQRAEMRREK